MANHFRMRHERAGEKSKIAVDYGQNVYTVRPQAFVEAAKHSAVELTDVAYAMAELLERGLATLTVEEAVPGSALASMLPSLQQG